MYKNASIIMIGKCTTYHVDIDRRIIFLNDNWQPFAEENDAYELTSNAVLDKSIFDFITDESCRHLYDILIERCTKTQKILELSFRCDSPKKRRFMRMQIAPLANETTAFKSCIVREEKREAVELLDRNKERSNEFLKICSWCKKVFVDNFFWVEVEAAIKHLGLFGDRPMPQLTHGMCPMCCDYVKRTWSRASRYSSPNQNKPS